MSKYMVHFEVTPDIEVSVLVETHGKDEAKAVELAKQKLMGSDFAWVATKPYVTDLLE